MMSTPLYILESEDKSLKGRRLSLDDNFSSSPNGLLHFPSVCFFVPNSNNDLLCGYKLISQVLAWRKGGGVSDVMSSCHLQVGFLLAFLCGRKINDIILRKLSECPRGLPYKKQISVELK